jgi:hypothetical protein
LENTNKLLDEWCEARDLAGPWPTVSGPAKKKVTEREYQLAMYVYRELDNFEYAIEKYRIGFMEPETAHRCLRTFRARCAESDDFRILAKKCVYTPAYVPKTQEIVDRVVDGEADKANSRPS